MKIVRMFSQIETVVTATMARIKDWLSVSRPAALLALIGCIASASTAFAANPYLVRTFEDNGRLIDEIIVPPSPPPGHQSSSRSGARTQCGGRDQHTY